MSKHRIERNDHMRRALRRRDRDGLCGRDALWKKRALCCEAALPNVGDGDRAGGNRALGPAARSRIPPSFEMERIDYAAAFIRRG
jgi:hypothetical protein